MKPHENIGRKTARGAALMAGASVFGKVLAGLSQIALAFLLFPEEFGLVAMAFTVIGLTRAIEMLGLREILVREQGRLERWVNSAMWLAGAFGVIGMTATVLLAPVAAYFFDEPRVLPLILVLAPSSFLLSLSQICESTLERDMRFRELGWLHIMNVGVQSSAQVVLALFGFGAFSFVIARTLMCLVRVIYTWSLVRPKITRSPQFHRWGSLLKRGLPVAAAAVCSSVIDNADYIILGIITTKVAVGYYFFAYMQSMQFVQIFNNTLARALMPGLSTMREDPVRMTRAYMGGIRSFGGMIAPLCMIQAACAEPLLRVLFGAKWEPSVVLLQVLSISVIFFILYWPTIPLMMAQGRYALRFVLTLVGSLLIVGALTVGALIGHESGDAALGAAIGGLVFRALWGPFQTHVVCRDAGVPFVDSFMVFLRPTLNSIIAIGPVWWLSGLLVPEIFGSSPWMSLLVVMPEARLIAVPFQLAQMAFVLGVGLMVYTLLLRCTQADQYHTIAGRLLSVLPARITRFIPAWAR